MINSYLQGKAHQDDHAIHLLFSANRWEDIQGLLDEVVQGTTLVVDRYSFSGAVYSAAKENPDLSLEWAWSPEIGTEGERSHSCNRGRSRVFAYCAGRRSSKHDVRTLIILKIYLKSIERLRFAFWHNLPKATHFSFKVD